MELRVHGIGGPDPAGVLGCEPNATVVSWRSEPHTRSVVRARAGDREVQVYHWSPLTSGSRSFALWPLLLPFTLVNVAGWMAPAGKRADFRRALHRFGAVWVGLATTAATVVWLLVAAMAVWRKVAGGDTATRPPGAVSGWFFTAAAASAALAMVALVVMATYMATGFERYRPTSWEKPPAPWRWPWGAGASATLDDLAFYDNGNEHKARWRIHVGVAAVTFAAVVGFGYGIGTGRAGHVIGRALVVVGILQGLGAAVIAVAGIPAGDRDGPRLTRRLLGAATAVLGILFLGGLVLSALISFTGIQEVPPGPVGALYDCYGWAMIATLACTLFIVLLILLTAVKAEEGPTRALLPTFGARLRSRLATLLSNVDRIVCALAVTFSLAAVVAVVVRWPAISDDRWRLRATLPVNVARSTFGFVLAFTVLNLVKSRASPSSLRRIGNVWDIITFWPRTFHPFAVRPYTERAVPELQEFLRAAPRHGGLVVAAHSQGTVLMYAAIRPYVKDGKVALPPFSLVTFGSPLRTLYHAVFPHYFEVEKFAETRDAIAGGWVNRFRFTDHIGRALWSDETADGYDPAGGSGDLPIADARPPGARVMGHNDYWPEPAVREAVLGSELTGRLP